MSVEIKQGDCVELMKELLPNSIDLTVTSPPYDNLRHYNGYNFDFESTAKELYRITKEGGIVVWIVNDAMIDGSETGTSFKQALFFKEIGFNLHDTMIWKKENPFNFGSNNCYIQSFEYMFVLSKGKPKTLNFIRDRKVQGYDGNTLNRGVARNRKTDKMEYSSRTWVMTEYGKRHNVWEKEASTNYQTHTATFPVELVRDHIISWSNEGDVVLDCFMGSGSTGVACLQTNRKFVGFEISEEYFELAKDRLKNAHIQSQLTRTNNSLTRINRRTLI